MKALDEDLFSSKDSKNEEEAFIKLDTQEKNAMEYDDRTNDSLFSISHNDGSEKAEIDNHSSN